MGYSQLSLSSQLVEYCDCVVRVSACVWVSACDRSGLALVLGQVFGLELDYGIETSLSFK